MENEISECEKDGFPILEINGKPHCLAEFVDFCIGGEKIADVVQRNDTLYYVFENRHEIPLLCFCCDKPLECPNLYAEQKRMRGRKLQAMSWDTEEYEDGESAIIFELEFSPKSGEKEPLIVNTSTTAAEKMRHPVTCPHSGLPSPISNSLASPANQRPRKRSR